MLENIKSFILERLKEFEGNEFEICDLGSKLSESENCNGSWYCSRYKAEQEIKDNWDFCKSFFEYYESNFDQELNPFDSENFHCLMMIFAVGNAFDYAISNIEIDNDERIEIDEEFISKIETGLQNLELDYIF